MLPSGWLCLSIHSLLIRGSFQSTSTTTPSLSVHSLLILEYVFFTPAPRRASFNSFFIDTDIQLTLLLNPRSVGSFNSFFVDTQRLPEPVLTSKRAPFNSFFVDTIRDGTSVQFNNYDTFNSFFVDTFVLSMNDGMADYVCFQFILC